MAKNYLLQHGSRQTPQSEPMRPDQVENSAGGFVWAVDPWMRLRRFLILGSEGGSYYADERKLTKQNVKSLRECLSADGLRFVNEVVEVSHSGRAPKNDQALFALACAISYGDKATKSAAAEALPKVARIGTHLYQFVAFAETMRGWGRVMRWAVSNWYAKNPEQLALQAVKYRQREGWSHRDLLRLAHPKNAQNAPLFEWIVRGTTLSDEVEDRGLIQAFEQAQRATTPKVTAALVREYRLPREALLSEHLNDIDVWAALLEAGMPMTAMLRNLATMTRVGILDSSEHKKLVIEAFDNVEAIRKSRLHPLAILVGQRTYAAGRGDRGGKTWTPKPWVTDALDSAFYLAFDNVEPTGKSTLLALDVSPSMAGGRVAGSPLTPREASVAMALVTLHAEPDVEVVGFAGKLDPLGLSKRQRLDDAVRSVSNIGWARTDCALPFLHALGYPVARDRSAVGYRTAQSLRSYETFVVYTDSETWAGVVHPKQALDEYRQRSGINARSVVVGMVSNGFSIADPNDPGMLDVVGFDTAAPALISEFTAGRL